MDQKSKNIRTMQEYEKNMKNTQERLGERILYCSLENYTTLSWFGTNVASLLIYNFYLHPSLDGWLCRSNLTVQHITKEEPKTHNASKICTFNMAITMEEFFFFLKLKVNSLKAPCPAINEWALMN